MIYIYILYFLTINLYFLILLNSVLYFHKSWGYPKMDGLYRTILLKSMIWGYLYFRTPPYVAMGSQPTKHWKLSIYGLPLWQSVDPNFRDTQLQAHGFSGAIMSSNFTSPFPLCLDVFWSDFWMACHGLPTKDVKHLHYPL